MLKIICICGARPNFMKIAPIMTSFNKCGQIKTLLVHTGQHYDKNMSHQFFEQLEIPKPDVNLEVGSGSHAVQTAEIMTRFEPVALDFNPDYVLVVGDINSTIACGLVAVKLGFKLIHVEAGLRSFDRTMPEEINRILTDSISDLLFVTEQSGVDNLAHEGIRPDKVYLVGNVMIDTLLAHKKKAEQSTILKALNLTRKRYGVITLHRPSNVDNPEQLKQILDGLEYIQNSLRLIFSIHPRTYENLKKTKLIEQVGSMHNLILCEPAGYLDFLKLMDNAALVITDSGGIQEETTILGIPCLTLRRNTERPVTITEGTNQLVDPSADDLIEHFIALQSNNFMTTGKTPTLWDGNAAQRITDIVIDQTH